MGDLCDPIGLVLGSNEWVRAVYACGPARDVNGKGRSTVRHFQGDGEVGRDGEEECANVFEGRHENAAGILLNVLRNSKFVARFKPQPFRLTKARHGVDAYPDFLVDLSDGRRFVIEVKTNRWFDEKEKDQQEAICQALKDTSMRLVIWTDKYPLARSVFHNMNHMRRANNLRYEQLELEKVADALTGGPKQISDLTGGKTKASFDHVLAAAYQGNVHLNYLLPITESTYVYRNRNDRNLETLVTPWKRNVLEWDSLPGVAVE